MAAAYLTEIRQVQAEGPYNLLGTCMGAMVAFEMAQQLVAAGQEVGLLVLVEPPRYDGLRQQSRFAVLSTAKLARVSTLTLPGEFGFDAISPDRRILYVIQHASTQDLVRYVVRAYDLRAGRLLPQAIVCTW